MKLASNDYIKKLSVIAFPIVIQNLLSSSLSFLDTLMIGQIGTVEIAAVGIANQIFFLVNLFIFGIASGASIFFSQYYGAGKEKELEKVMGLGVAVSLVGSIIWALISFFAPEWIMTIFTEDVNAIKAGADYQRIVSVSYIFFAISMIHGFAYRSIGKANLPLIASIISLCTNAVGNYLLIFGIGPFPYLGVAGAAIATLIARFIDMAFMVFVSYMKKAPFRIRSLDAFRWKGSFISMYMKTSLPVLINEMLWALGMTVYKVAYARLGINALAAMNVSEAIGNFFFIASMGIGNATTIALGQTLGGGNIQETKDNAKTSLKISLLIGLAMGVLMAAFAPFFVSWFNIDAATARIARLALYVTALFQPLKSMNMILIVGILRSGGDTRYALFAEMACVWLFGVPMAFLGAVLLGLPLPVVYLMVCFEEAGKTILCLPRYKSGKWIKILAN